MEDIKNSKQQSGGSGGGGGGGSKVLLNQRETLNKMHQLCHYSQKMATSCSTDVPHTDLG